MPAASKHRENLIQAAAKLFRQRGYAATGLNDILRESGAPKGSLYHYFPGGKEALGEAAVRWAGERGRLSLMLLREREPDTPALLQAYASQLAAWMMSSGCRDGCPIATTVLEAAPAVPALTTAGREAFQSWSEELTQALRRDGLTDEPARRLAQLAIAAMEGALILSRVEGTGAPIIEAIEDVALLIRLRLDRHVAN
ncbi:TetR family transcriptional regulator [Pseudomonas sp. WN033]|nr:TetR family transcriptional regulator [Pseudomonas sp. WN033]